MTAGDNFFEFNGERNPMIQVGANVDIEIPVNNTGTAIHNVHVASTGSYEEAFCTVGGPNPCSDPARISGGDSGVLRFNLPPGTYDYRCDFHTTQMFGQFEVVEGGPTGAPEAPPPGEEPGAPPPGEPTGETIDLEDNVFVFNGEENPTITIAPDTEMTFTLNNTGTAIHNMHVAASGEFQENFCTGQEDPCSAPPRISGGDTGTITLNLPPGTYDYRCDFHTTEMNGTIEVQ
jgi:plastocyanin